MLGGMFNHPCYSGLLNCMFVLGYLMVQLCLLKNSLCSLCKTAKFNIVHLCVMCSHCIERYDKMLFAV